MRVIPLDESLREVQARHATIAQVSAGVLVSGASPKQAPAAYKYLAHWSSRDAKSRQIITSFEAPQLMRRLDKAPSSFHDPTAPDVPAGQLVRLYRRPSPSEQQARIAYENVAEEWGAFLLQRYRCPTLQQTQTQMVVFVPEGTPFQLEALWKEFLHTWLFSADNLSRTLLQLLNLTKLSDRGFSAPDVLLVSPGMRDFMAAWFYRTFKLVEKRLASRSKRIATDNEMSDAKKAKEQELQDKEVDKYQSNFARYQQNIENALQSHKQQLDKIDADIEKLKKKEGKKYEGLLAKRAKHIATPPFPEEAWKRLSEVVTRVGCDPFLAIPAEMTENPERYSRIIGISKAFKRTAADQLNHPRGDIFGAMLFEMLRIANVPDEACQMHIPPLYTENPLGPLLRVAGDDQKEACFACGAHLDQEEMSFEIRRMIFTKPEQRLQSSNGPVAPKCCASCVVYAYVCGVKPTDDTAIIKIEPTRDTPQLSARAMIKQVARAIVSKELHVQAGPYLMLSCPDYVGTGNSRKAVSVVVGEKAYSHYRLAHDLHPAVLQQVQVSVCRKGKDELISNARILWLHALLKASDLRLTAANGLSLPMAKAIRYVLNDLFIEAEYTLVSHTNQNDTFQRSMAPFRQQLIDLLRQEETMDHKGKKPSIASHLKTIAAMTGLLSAFVNKLKSTLEKGGEPPETVHREMAKLIEACHDPVIWNNRFASSKGIQQPEARLYKGFHNQFFFQEAKALLQELSCSQESMKTEPPQDGEESEYLSVNGSLIMEAYSKLFEGLSSYEQRELTTRVRLSLYSQFPSVLSRYK